MSDEKETEKLLYCNFCGKSQHEVKKLVAGPAVYVCDECTALCVNVIIEESEPNDIKEFVSEIDEDIKAKMFNGNVNAIIREIEFPPEYRHAGITILANFNSLIRDKYGDENVKVSIQQEENKVILIIESEEGIKERIEETLETYSLVLSGKKPMQDLTTNPYAIADLNQQLRIAQIQLENQRELLQIEQRHSAQLDDKNKSIESQYQEMIGILSFSITAKNNNNSFTTMLAQTLATSQSQTAENAINALINIVQEKNDTDKSIVVETLENIKSESPTTFNKIKDFAESCTAGVVGSYVYSWIIPIINSLPK